MTDVYLWLRIGRSARVHLVGAGMDATACMRWIAGEKRPASPKLRHCAACEVVRKKLLLVTEQPVPA